MTYPTQPGQPHGQGGPISPQSGYFPQAQPMPAQGQTGQFPRVPYGAGFGAPPPPPGGGNRNKRNVGLWAGFSAAAIVVVAFVVTAFVVPGFLVSDDGDRAGENGVPGTGAEAFAGRLVDALVNHDLQALGSFKCYGADEIVSDVIEESAMIEEVALGKVVERGDTATAKVTIKVKNESFEFTAGFAKDERDWCWRSLDVGYSVTGATPPSSAPMPPNR